MEIVLVEQGNLKATYRAHGVSNGHQAGHLDLS